MATTAPNVVRDAAGRPVPERLRDTFLGRSVLASCFDQVRRAEACLRVVADEPYALLLNQETLRRAFAVLEDELSWNMPAYVCHDPRHGRDCPRCNGRGWLSENQVQMESNADLVSILEDV